jgi:hypothetical protein
MKIMNKIMGTVNKNSNIYEKCGIESYVNFYTACVNPKYRGNLQFNFIYGNNTINLHMYRSGTSHGTL